MIERQTEVEETYDLGLLDESMRSWRSNEGLRVVYEDLYRMIRGNCCSGTSLEIGAGIGVSKSYFDNLVTSDIALTSYVDQAMSAYDIVPPEGESGWGNIFALDVLHHLMKPMDFFESAANALQPGGRIILIEPMATLGGRLFYGIFHHEPIQPDLICSPFEFEPNGDCDEFANMGMAEGLFRWHRDETEARLAQYGLSIRKLSYRDLLAYPLTGGYSRSQMMPTLALKGLLRLERCLPQCLLKFFALRMLIVLEKEG